MSIVLANYYGRILAICPGAPHQGGPDATTHVFGRPLSLDAIRIKILYYLGTQNILVGFHLGWILTSIGLCLPAHRVVELGEEPAFQGYVQNIATASGFPDDFFRGNQVPSFDRRWPAIFATTYFNFGTGPGLAIREAYYTASLWQLLSKQICTRKINAAVFRLKQAYVVGCGAGLTPHEYSLVRHDNPKPNNKDLTRHKRDDRSVVT